VNDRDVVRDDVVESDGTVNLYVLIVVVVVVE